MSDLTAAAVSSAQLSQLNTPQALQTFDVQETRMFARMMQEGPQSPALAGGVDGLRSAALSMAEQLKGPTLEELRHTMLERMDWRDPVGAIFATTDYSLQVHTMFAKLHIAGGLAEAATHLFGGLLKNQG
jgi:hypothetical protein